MNVSTKQQRIAELAKQQPEMSFTSLNPYLDVDWLREAYRRLRKDKEHTKACASVLVVKPAMKTT